MFESKVQCPQCKKIWTLPQGMSEVECTCHLFCSEGDTPSDCAVIYPYNYEGQLKWPTGLHVKAENEGDDILHRGGYCTTHNRYTNKEPIWLEVNLEEWFAKRAPKKLRSLQM